MPTAIVTGSSRGIGRGIAKCLAQAGHNVMINYTRNEKAAKEAAEEVMSCGAKAALFQASVTEIDNGRALVDRTLEEFGRLDLLVNNAGIAPSVRADILEAEPESYDEVMATNLRGPYFLTQYAANQMIQLKDAGKIEAGRIVVISSISAFTASASRGEYCVSKTGLSMMTRLFADRLAEYGITVNEVQPGIIQTDMTGPVKEKYDALIANGLTPIRRWGQPEDIGKAVVAIANGYLDFTTGAAIPVDGGFHIRRL
ncbi:MAG: 3-ketoacyl-ACP reductase [Candidatus Latescibacterota bacterium]|nr:3-ketoacyl-ACP reductase [Candidatus Latescibacterota bacterium]